jgi:hypothetical protein
VPSTPHWTASIGTGHATEVTKSASAKSIATGPINAAAHWTSNIGTGHASQSNAGTRSLAAVASRARP